eukprot:CFRG6580T1
MSDVSTHEGIASMSNEGNTYTHPCHILQSNKSSLNTTVKQHLVKPVHSGVESVSDIAARQSNRHCEDGDTFAKQPTACQVLKKKREQTSDLDPTNNPHIQRQ